MEKLENTLIAIFCDIDEFCKGFKEYWDKHLISNGKEIMPRCKMSLFEIMSIVIFFHLSNQRCFK